MLWFRRNAKQSNQEVAEEIAAHKAAVHVAAQEAKNASGEAKSTISNNGFTVIIAASMGAPRHIEVGK